MADLDALVSGLRKWTKDHDGHVRAAVEYLIADGYWLDREDFTAAAVHWSGGVASVDWDAARLPPGDTLGAPSSKAAILRLAIAVGSDEFRLSRMSDEEAMAAVQLAAGAVALKVEVTGGG